MEEAAEELASIMKDLAGVKGAVDEQVQVSVERSSVKPW